MPQSIMKILAIDTSTTSGSVALLEGTRLMAEWTLESAQTHNRRLLRTIDDLLRQAGWAIVEIDGFAVSTGPGSFTGIRIGLTTMKTLAWALGRQFAAIPTLDALAAPFRFSRLPVCAMLDARKKEVYCALYRADGAGRICREGPYRAIPPEQVAGLIEAPTIFCGDGWLLYRSEILEKVRDLAVEASASQHIVRAGAVGELAARKFADGCADDPVTTVPIYVRPSEAEVRYPHLGHLAKSPADIEPDRCF
jgi:tRNA threonylcarbamoyladenosine biosynthesis protein TsaB